MPPLIVPSPIVLDHSFPRSDLELRIAAAALGALVRAGQRGDLKIAISSVLREFTSEIDWTSPHQGLLREIYVLHAQWFLRPTDLVQDFDLSSDPPAGPHPLPCRLLDSSRLTSKWAEEVGRLHARHNRMIAERPGCIGIACAEAFADPMLPACPTQEVDTLAIVGPSDLSSLSDAYSWQAKPVPGGAWISLSAAEKHIHLLGGALGPKKSGSHRSVIFPGHRSWVLDNDPVPNAFLNELKPITGMSLDVIRSVLYYGEPPVHIFRLSA